MSYLYRVVDLKSCCAEYFIASCDEDAFRIWSVMSLSSRPMYEFLDDYELQRVRQLPDTAKLHSGVIMDGKELKRRIDARRKEIENAKVKM